MSLLFSIISPDVEFSIPISILSNVVFPHPDGPSIDRNSPSFTSKLILFNTVFLLYIFHSKASLKDGHSLISKKILVK